MPGPRDYAPILMAVGGAASIYIEGRRRRSGHLYRRPSAAQRAFISKDVGGAASIYIEGRRRRSEHLYRRPSAAQAGCGRTARSNRSVHSVREDYEHCPTTT